jgi:hypothetical protein
MHGNLGVMYARNNELENALTHLSLAVQGGTTEAGIVVQGIPLSYKPRVIEIYSSYSLTLARTGNCDQAVPIFQTMLGQVGENEIAVANANEGLNICGQYLDETPPTAVP